MTDIASPAVEAPSREGMIHQLYEAAELEHNLMCTYLYAAFSLKDGEAEGLSPVEAEAVGRWRREILKVAIEEMGHLTAVWNITSSLGGSPQFGRDNFPLDPGGLPAGVVVKLAPFNAAVIQHFVHLERPKGSTEPDGEGFAPPRQFRRGVAARRLTPMGVDYDTVGDFYAKLHDDLEAFVAQHGEDEAFCGDPGLQLSANEIALFGARPVICSKTALAAFNKIVEQGEGALVSAVGSHFHTFLAIREELVQLKEANPKFAPAWPAAENPILRPPVTAGKRVWLENEEAARTVDVANSCYALMLRLIAHSYLVPRLDPMKGLAVDLGLGLMRAMTLLAERAARLPAGPSNPDCNAGMSFSALRDSAPFPPGAAAGRFFAERISEIAEGVKILDAADPRVERATRMLEDLARRAARGFSALRFSPPTTAAPTPQPAAPAPAIAPQASDMPARRIENHIECVEGKDLTLIYEGRKCIHSRFCVTWGPKVFLANVEGPWIHPDAMDSERVAEIAHVCPSGAIRYARKDGRPDEAPPPVNLITVREAGPYAVRAAIRLDGEDAPMRATLCRCGASKHKPYCDGSHKEIGFDASGEPPTGKADMLPVRDGVLAIDPETDGPLQVRGNLEIVSGTGRVVVRTVNARLCRCGGSANKPFCDGTHAKIGFRSTNPA